MTEPAVDGSDVGYAPPRVTRRSILFGAAAAAAGAGAAVAVDRFLVDAGTEHDAPDLLAWHAGAHQCGVDMPARPPHHLLFSALTWQRAPTPDHVRHLLGRIGQTVLDLVEGAPREVLPDGPGVLMIQVGIGPRAVRLFGTDLPGAKTLPAFAGSDDIDPHQRSGDIVLLVAADDPSVLAPVTQHVTAETIDPAAGWSIAWQQQALRPPGEGPRTRTPLGHHDGVVVPDDSRDMATGVWISDGPAATGTIGVVRRFALDHQAFDALSEAERDAVIGRRRVDGAPLSGGTIDSDVDLSAKSPSGDYLIPANAHVRAAHPSFTASPLMMRRSYGFSEVDSSTGRSSPGLLFISYQNDLDTFSRTQLRMDDMDDLMTFATATAETSFLVLPGFDRSRPLGSTL